MGMRSCANLDLIPQLWYILFDYARLGPQALAVCAFDASLFVSRRQTGMGPLLLPVEKGRRLSQECFPEREADRLSRSSVGGGLV